MTTALQIDSPPDQKLGKVDRFFGVTARGSTRGREIRGGFVNFFTTCYILALNPIILSGAKGAPSFLAIAAGTALVAGFLTLLMAFMGRVPIVLAAGLGINAIVAFQLAPAIGYRGAMGTVVIEGAITVLLVAVGLRERLFAAVPMALKHGLAVGIGLFIAIIGLMDGGIAKGAAGGQPLMLTLNSWPDLVFIITLLLALVLYVRKVRGALIISIIVGTVLSIVLEAILHLGSVTKNPGGWQLNVPSLAGTHILTMPHPSTLGMFSVTDPFRAHVVQAIAFIISLVLTDLFDTFGTVVAIGHEAGLLDNKGNLPRMKGIFYADAIGAATGGLGGVSSNTSYIESTAGVSDGARTGLANIVTGLLFIVAMFLTPLAQLIPSEAAAPVLVVVGLLMMKQVTQLPWGEPELWLPAVLGALIMPFTYSITNGIGVAFITYIVTMLARRRARDIHWLAVVLAAVFVAYFILKVVYHT